MFCTIILFFCSAFWLNCTRISMDQVQWICSTDNIQWQIMNPIGMIDTLYAEEPNLNIYLDKKEQTIDGFGGCFNELGCLRTYI